MLNTKSRWQASILTACEDSEDRNVLDYVDKVALDGDILSRGEKL